MIVDLIGLNMLGWVEVKFWQVWGSNFEECIIIVMWVLQIYGCVEYVFGKFRCLGGGYFEEILRSVYMIIIKINFFEYEGLVFCIIRCGLLKGFEYCYYV